MSKNWAICIGINHYYNLQPLKYAVQDASSVRDFFLNEVKFEKVYYFSDDSPPIVTPKGEMRSLPTYANLKRFFREWFQSKSLGVGDNFWFFFAGHGEIHDDHDYLLPIDADPGDIAGTALRMSDIADSLRNCGADNTVLLVDACRDRGKRKGQGFGVEAQQGLIAIYSCSPHQSSYEIEDLQHGSFTYALLEGLRLQGANNCATVERLDQYLCIQVPALNERYGKPPQMPRTSVEPISKNHLILLPQQATRLQDVLMLKHDAQAAELNDDLEFAQQLWVRVLAASPADGGAIAAIGRIAVKRSQRTTNPSSLLTTADSRRIEAPVSEKIPKPQTVDTGKAITSEETRQVEYQRDTSDRDMELDVVAFLGDPFQMGLADDDDDDYSLGTAILADLERRRTVTGKKTRQVEYRREMLDRGVELDMVAIPGGIFQMGSADGEGENNERPQHSVTVKPFWMGKYQVTQAQWRAVAALSKVERDLKSEPSRFKGDRLPVEQVSWDDAVEFCKRLSKHTGRAYRLPSEAEWEYACRAKTTTPFYFGDTLSSKIANYNANHTYGNGQKGEYRNKTTDVDSFSANAFGLCDMHGNVWEWCLDHWHKNYAGAPTDGSAWLSADDNAYRLLRGGSWGNNPDKCRSANRVRYTRDLRLNNFGFRVVCGSSWTLA
ncbi:MAG: SUMF1/EgtB/PvdO family nonheme iron enzyme [Phormidesmis sp.]